MNCSARQIVCLLALAATLMRAAIPSGWMPATDSGALLALCTADGLVQMAVADLDDRRDGAAGSQQPSHDGQLLCPFAAAGAIGASPSDRIPSPAGLASCALDDPIGLVPSFANPRGSRLPRAPPACLIAA
jgi:hypothetical protein